MVDIVCVNWGSKYGTEYTRKLYEMVKRNTTRDFKFYCLTDNLSIYDTPIIPVKIKGGYAGWWNKMQIFRDDMLPAGEYLYLDLDVVIVDNIDSILDFTGFGITRDFINPDTGILGGKEYNSSVMRFTQDINLWKFFYKNQEKWKKIQAQIPFFGDQNVISAYLNEKAYANPFPDEWLWSFKMGTLRGRRPVEHDKFFGAQIPNNGKICIFHGLPNPSDVSVDWVTENWRA